jgi:hypothetical protein
MYRKIFTDEWAQACGEHINKSMEYFAGAADDTRTGE